MDIAIISVSDFSVKKMSSKSLLLLVGCLSSVCPSDPLSPALIGGDRRLPWVDHVGGLLALWLPWVQVMQHGRERVRSGYFSPWLVPMRAPPPGLVPLPV